VHHNFIQRISRWCQVVRTLFFCRVHIIITQYSSPSLTHTHTHVLILLLLTHTHTHTHTQPHVLILILTATTHCSLLVLISSLLVTRTRIARAHYKLLVSLCARAHARTLTLNTQYLLIARTRTH
jgi:hypothetical protein